MVQKSYKPNEILFDRNKTVCFSGHRPEKLPDGDIAEKILKSLLLQEIKDTIDSGFDTFISGGARGFDIWAGNIVAELRRRHKIRLIAALPYEKHGENFTGKDKFEYGFMVDNADAVIFTSDEYSRSCMKIRNKYMIDVSGKLIAFMADAHSGTGMTVRFAQNAGIIVKMIESN
ncbi:MAG: SLOG family protein [Ruminococcus sp.]|nr:SLOG family protein [Ruminococcus sp.]